MPVMLRLGRQFSLEQSDEIDSNLLVAKSRVAPKGQTLPRKELLGALQMSKLFEVARNVVSSVLKVNEEFYFSDSKTALCWIYLGLARTSKD